MTSTITNKVSIVQETALGSLTQNKKESTHDDPFRRSSRLTRSPVRASEPRTVSPSVSENSLQRDTAAPSPYESVIVLARREEEEHLRTCLDTIKLMKAAMNRQKNISQDVKTGIATLESSFNHILHLRKSWQSCERTLVSSSTQTTPPRLLSQASNAASFKRVATSPAEPEIEKKKKTDESTEEIRSGEWVTVARKRNKNINPPKQTENKTGEQAEKKPQKKRSPKQRSDALLIRPSTGKTFADVLGEIRQKAKPEEKGASIKALRKTRAGDLLVELGQSTGNKSDFGADLQSILGNNATVRLIEPMLTLEVRDLDELTTEEEVTTAVRTVIGPTAEVKTFVSKANSRGQKLAILTLGAKDAGKLLKEGHIKVGWVRCRVREKLVASRCFKCLGFGHVANRCNGPDRSKMCFKCGGQDHKASTCTAAESCVLCTEAGLKEDLIKHAAGSSRCGAYKQALQKLRASAKK